MFGGAAPDALAALVAMLATLRDEQGNTTITGLDNTQTWTGAPYPPEQFRSDAGVLDGVALLGDGSVSDMLWARPAVTILGIDCPPVVGLGRGHRAAGGRAAEPAHPARAWPPDEAQDALVDAPPGRGALGRPGHRETSRRRGAVPGGTRRAGVRGHGRGDAGGLRQADDHARAGRLDPAVQRVRRHLPRRRDHPDGRRGAAGAHPRPERERRPERDRAMALAEALFLQRYATT